MQKVLVIKMTKLWFKGKDVKKEVEKYLASDISADQKMVKHEVLASIAHAKMLQKINILTKEELSKLELYLKKIIELDKKGKFIIKPEDEDVHTKVENYLTEKLGDIGKKIHTYRSRNDQVLVNQRLYNKEKLIEIQKKLIKLCKTLLEFSKNHEYVAMPGYTHLQKAMLSSVGLWSSSFIESLLDDLKLLKNAFDLNNQCPLGSAASYGVPTKIDREYTSNLLGFEKVQNNVLYCQNSRGKIESIILSALSQIMIDLGKFSTDAILFSMPEFGYFEMSDEVTTGSSIMPQKKNPDVAELIKGNVSVVLGYESIVKNTIKDLPSGYNKETQVVKEHTVKALNLTIDSIKMMNLIIKTLKVNKQKCEEACIPEIFATDYAYELVKSGTPFREAYKITAKNLDKIQKPNLQETLKKRNHLGGTGNLGLKKLEKEINSSEKFVEVLEKKLVSCGDDIDKIDGDILLKFAEGNEPFTELNSEQIKNPKPGEVVYVDDKEVLCRRWNWRECDKSKMTEESKNVILVIEGLPPFTKDEIEEILGELSNLVQKFCGGEISTKILSKDELECIV